MPLDRARLHAAIVDSRELAPRCVAADALDDGVDDARAEFIRLQCRLAQTPASDPLRLPLLRRMDALEFAHEAAWLGEWRERLIDWKFELGFLDSVRITLSNFLDHGKRLAAWEPVRAWEIVNDQGQALDEHEIRAAVGSPAFGQVRACRIVYCNDHDRELFPVWLTALHEAAHVEHLRSLVFTHPACWHEPRHTLPRRLFRRFCRARHLASIQQLDLSHHAMPNDRLIDELSQATFAANLRELSLVNCDLKRWARVQLAEDPVFARLRGLDLMQYDSPNWLEEVLRSKTLCRIESLSINEAMLPALASGPLALGLSSIAVHRNDEGLPDNLRDEAWLRLVQFGRRPRRLAFSNHDPGPVAEFAMLSHGWLDQLESLTIIGADNWRRFRDVMANDAAPNLRECSVWNVRSTNLATCWPGFRRIEHFDCDDIICRGVVDAVGEALSTATNAIARSPEQLTQLLDALAKTRLRRLKLLLLGGEGTGALVASQYLDRLRSAEALRPLERLCVAIHFPVPHAEKVMRQIATEVAGPRLRRLTVQCFENGFSTYRSSLPLSRPGLFVNTTDSYEPWF